MDGLGSGCAPELDGPPDQNSLFAASMIDLRSAAMSAAAIP
jgi:hypothetical protein